MELLNFTIHENSYKNLHNVRKISFTVILATTMTKLLKIINRNFRNFHNNIIQLFKKLFLHINEIRIWNLSFIETHGRIFYKTNMETHLHAYRLSRFDDNKITMTSQCLRCGGGPSNHRRPIWTFAWKFRLHYDQNQLNDVNRKR